MHGVPLLDLAAQYAPLRSDILAALTRVADSQRYILGPETSQLEQELAAMIGCREAIAVSSGTDALLVSLMALGIGPGDEVVTTTYSFFATAGCIVRLGARPVFVDIDPETFNLSPAAVDRAITPRTRAIVPVHLYGHCVDVAAIQAIADAHDLPIIEDACQAIGASAGGRQAGTFGRAGCFSFFPSKNLGGFGDSGLVVTQDAAFAEEVRLLRGHGATRRYYHLRVGGNFRIDELQAAVLRVKAPHLAAWNAARRRNAERYRALFTEAALDQVTLPVERPGFLHTYHQFVIRTPHRDRVMAHLTGAGIGCAIYYPVPFHRQECFAALGYGPGDFPMADAAADESLALPIFAELSEEQQRTVVSAIALALKSCA